jgi:xanthine dehydrogenase YagR molybdenum-binding subunit
MTSLLEPRAIGRDLVRRDGAAKVRGIAVYADETPVPEDAGPALYCRIVTATVARGRVRGVDTAAAQAVPGVVRVITASDAERLASTDDRELAVLQDDRIDFRGQIVAAVLAETDEAAREAADLV